MNNSPKDKIIQAFDKGLTKYEKEFSIKFSDNARVKLADSYASTLVMEKDIEVNDWIEENIDEILSNYKDEISLTKEN